MSHVRMQCRRGMLELDVILERFLNHHYDHLTDHQKQQFSRLLEAEDPILYDWLVVGIPCTDVTLQEIVGVVGVSHGI